MRPVLRTLMFTTAALAGVALFATSASANWSKFGGDCDKTAFATPDTVSVPDLSKCVRLWEAYQDISKVSGDYRDRAIAAMKRLYVQGNDRDASVARGALQRLRVTDLPERSAAATAAKPEARKPAKPKRQRFEAPEPSKSQIRRAESAFKRGFKAYRKDDHGKALTAYLQMVEYAPGYAKGHYNVACIYALQGNEDKMLEYLFNLSDLGAAGDDKAKEMLKMTLTDTDFDGMRDKSDRYKTLTGYARIKVLNAMGEMGEDNVDNLTASLKKLGYSPDGPDGSGNPRKHPIIWYGEHASGAAYIVKELLNHPNTQVVLFTPEQLKGYDVVVVWGDDVKDNNPKTYVADPRDAEKKLDELARKQDEILSEPEAVADEIEDALGKPEEIHDRVEDNLERPGEAVERVEDTVDKIKGIF